MAIAKSLPAAVTEARRALDPAPRKAVAVALDGLFAWAAAFGLPAASEGQAAAVTRAYAVALADVPADLVMRAVERVQQTHRWGGRLPLPADLRAAIGEDLARRRTILARLEVAAWRAANGHAEREPVNSGGLTTAQVARLEEVRRDLAGRGFRGSPSPERPSRRERRRPVDMSGFALPPPEDPRVRAWERRMGEESAA